MIRQDTNEMKIAQKVSAHTQNINQDWKSDKNKELQKYALSVIKKYELNEHQTQKKSPVHYKI